MNPKLRFDITSYWYIGKISVNERNLSYPAKIANNTVKFVYPKIRSRVCALPKPDDWKIDTYQSINIVDKLC